MSPHYALNQIRMNKMMRSSRVMILIARRVMIRNKTQIHNSIIRIMWAHNSSQSRRLAEVAPRGRSRWWKHLGTWRPAGAILHFWSQTARLLTNKSNSSSTRSPITTQRSKTSTMTTTIPKMKVAFTTLTHRSKASKADLPGITNSNSKEQWSRWTTMSSKTVKIYKVRLTSRLH